jgi:hypothetical protein
MDMVPFICLNSYIFEQNISNSIQNTSLAIVSQDIAQIINLDRLISLRWPHGRSQLNAQILFPGTYYTVCCTVKCSSRIQTISCVCVIIFRVESFDLSSRRRVSLSLPESLGRDGVWRSFACVDGQIPMLTFRLVCMGVVDSQRYPLFNAHVSTGE